MKRLHGKFKRQKVVIITIQKGPGKGWTGKAIVYKNQNGTVIAKPSNPEVQPPSGLSYYDKSRFIEVD